MEKAIHAVCELFDLHSDDMSLSIQFFLAISQIVYLGVRSFLLSKEGVTQGDPLSMMLGAVAVLQLIHSLEDFDEWVQNWYADSSSCVGEVSSVWK